MKKLIAVAVLALIGCVSSPKFIDGTAITLGAYVPYQGNLYGIELISFVSGTLVYAPTNTDYEVTRTHTSTNDWMWGMMKSVETSDTKAKLLKP